MNESYNRYVQLHLMQPIFTIYGKDSAWQEEKKELALFFCRTGASFI